MKREEWEDVIRDRNTKTGRGGGVTKTRDGKRREKRQIGSYILKYKQNVNKKGPWTFNYN